MAKRYVIKVGDLYVGDGGQLVDSQSMALRVETMQADKPRAVKLRPYNPAAHMANQPADSANDRGELR